MIKKITKKEVPSILSNPDFWNRTVLPITKHKLWSLYNNPDAEAEDTLLLYSENENKDCIACAAIVHAKLNNKEQTKLGIFSSWWSNGEVKGLGMKILTEALQELNGKLISHLFLPETTKIYLRTNQFYVYKNYVGYYLNFSEDKPTALLQKIPKGKLFYKIYKRWIGKKNSTPNLQLNPDFSFETFDLIREEDSELLELAFKNNFLYRSAESLNWNKLYPWILESSILELENRSSYFFSQYRKNFKIHFIKISDQRNKAILVISISNGVLKMLQLLNPYHIDVNQISIILQKIIFQQKISQIITYDKNLRDYLVKSNFFLKETTSDRVTVVSNSFDINDVSSFDLQYGDGDHPFF